jgi:hypothetical protein
MSELSSSEQDPDQRFYSELSEHDQIFVTRADHIFEKSHAADWIKTIRAETNGILDIEATAHNLGVPLVMTNYYEDGEKMLADGCVTGLDGSGPVTIRIRTDLTFEETILTFGHEVGHIFLDQEVDEWMSMWLEHNQVEIFCDFFGREMVVDHNDLKDTDFISESTITGLMDRYGADHQTIIFGLMLAGKLPTRVIIDSEIGDVPNPYYSGKVGRQVICIECELGIPHSHNVDKEKTLVLDFRGYERQAITNHNECGGIPEIEDHITLNKHYGRWTEEDDALTAEEVDRNLSSQALIDRYRETGKVLLEGDEDITF